MFYALRHRNLGRTSNNSKKKAAALAARAIQASATPPAPFAAEFRPGKAKAVRNFNLAISLKWNPNQKAAALQAIDLAGCLKDLSHWLQRISGILAVLKAKRQDIQSKVKGNTI